MPTFASLLDLIKWLVYSGGAVIVVSWLLDKIPAFVALAQQTKYYIGMGSCVVVSLGAYALITYVPVAAWAILDPWFLIATGAIITFSAMRLYTKVSTMADQLYLITKK